MRIDPSNPSLPSTGAQDTGALQNNVIVNSERFSSDWTSEAPSVLTPAHLSPETAPETKKPGPNDPTPEPTPIVPPFGSNADQKNSEVQKKLHQIFGFAEADVRNMDPATFSRVIGAANLYQGYLPPQWQRALNEVAMVNPAALGPIMKTLYADPKLPVGSDLARIGIDGSAFAASAGKDMASLTLAAEDLSSGHWSAALQDAKSLINPGQARALVDAVYKSWDGGIQKTMQKTFHIMSGADLFDKVGAANVSVVAQAIDRVKNQDWGGALASVGQLNGALAGTPLASLGHDVAVAAYKLPTAGPLRDALTKFGIHNENDLAGKAEKAYQWAAAADRIVNHKDWGGVNGEPGALELAAQASPDLAKQVAVFAYDHAMSEGWRDKLKSLGLSRDDVGSLGAGTDHLFRAVDQAYKGNWTDFAHELGAAGSALGSALQPLEKKLVEHLPVLQNAQDKIALLRSHLSDQQILELSDSIPSAVSLVTALAKNPPDLEGAGNAISGLATAAPDVLNSLGNTLIKAANIPPDVVAKLKQFGINPQNIGQALAAVPAGIALANDLANNQPDKAFDDMGRLVSALPQGLRDSAVRGAASALHIPEGLVQAIAGAGQALGDPVVRADLHQALNAFVKGDVQGLVSSLADTGAQISNHDPDAAVSFLNGLQYLPVGNAAKLFANADLNARLVHTGAAGKLFDVIKDVVGKNASISQAFADLGSAAGDLLTQQPHLKIPVVGTELPINQDAPTTIQELLQTFYDAMPTSVREHIDQAVQDVAGKALGAVNPFVAAFKAVPQTIADVQNLVADLNKNQELKWVHVGLDGASAALDIASAVPELGFATGPLTAAVGIGQAFLTFHDLVVGAEGFFQIPGAGA